METNSRRFRAILVSLLFFSLSLNMGSGLAEVEEIEPNGPDIEIYDMVIGDTWVFNTELDVASLIDPTDETWFGTAIDNPLSGQTTRTVLGIETMEYKSKNYSVYEIKQEGNYMGIGTFPAPVLGLITGTMLVDYSATLWIRISDHATLREVTDIHIDLEHLAGVELLLDTVITREFDTDAEFFDFPTLWDETWTQTYIQNESWDGNSGYFSPPGNEKLIERAYGYNNYTSPPVNWNGCENSSYIQQTNSEGDITEYKWYCPSIRGTVVEWEEDIILGVPAYSELISFSPGEITTAQIVLEFEQSFESNNVTLNSPIIFDLTISLENGSSLENEIIKINYLGEYSNWTLNESNSATINISSNVSKDSTTTLYDWASHGVVIQLTGYDVFTTFTITLNSSSIAEGIALRSESLDLMSNWVDGSFELITIFGEQTRW